MLAAHISESLHETHILSKLCHGLHSHQQIVTCDKKELSVLSPAHPNYVLHSSLLHSDSLHAFSHSTCYICTLMHKVQQGPPHLALVSFTYHAQADLVHEGAGPASWGPVRCQPTGPGTTLLPGLTCAGVSPPLLAWA